jgi:6-phosphofructokinase 1
MDNKIKKIGVMTSGGDSPGMNAAIRAVVRTCHYYEIECIGIREGYNGMIAGDFITLGPRDVAHIINHGGTILQTSRSKEFMMKEGRKKAFLNLKQAGVDGLVCIGGDGTFTGAQIFSEEFDLPIIGLPGTIDNDIYGTDSTIGFDTAMNTAMEAIDKIRDTATSHNRVFFVEVMGRDAGFIALHSGIASGALDVLIPEKKDSLDDLFAIFERAKRMEKKSNIIVVAEGEELANVYDLAKMTRMKFPDYETRVVVLGHIQRGGSPTCADRILASRLGYSAVIGLMEGKTKVMAGIQANKLVFTPIEEAIKKRNEVDCELLKMVEVLSI